MAIETLFSNYLAAFMRNDLKALQALYSLPCMLATPDEVKWLTSSESFKSSFNDIFTQLNHANVATIDYSRASYCQLSSTLVNACVEWQFVDGNNQVFAQFCAFYVIHLFNEQWRIVNVTSFDISQYQQLANTFQF